MDAANSQYSCLGGVDYGSERIDIIHTEVRYCKMAGSQRNLFPFSCQVNHFSRDRRDFEQRYLIGIFQDLYH